MASIATATLAFVLFSCCSGAAIKQHNVTVSEHGAVYVQETDIDEANNVMYIHVPAHRDLPENKFMYEFTTGRVLRCTPSIQRCFLNNFDTQKVPDPATEEINIQMFKMRHHTPQTEEMLAEVEHQDMVVTEHIKDTTTLTALMRKTLGDYALYREEPLPKGAEILEGTVDVGLESHHLSRSKRAPISFCCKDNKLIEIRYARTSAASCNWLMWCQNPYDSNSCNERHFSGSSFYVCYCCPEQMKPKSCKGGCDPITNLGPRYSIIASGRHKCDDA